MKIYLDTIGCKLNQSEIEAMARQFRAAGYEVVASAQDADMAVVNTCAVTVEAASDSRGKLRNIARAGVNEIIATGCWVTLQPAQASALPNISRIVTNDRKDRLVADLLNDYQQAFDVEPIIREPLPGLHHRTRAFIKVQDGCDNHCTFCVTTIPHGESRSRPIADVISDVQYTLDGGAKEIVLTGVHLGSWGQDLNSHLRELVKSILRETGVPRLRLSSLEPWDLDADFFSLWQDERLCQHLHLPLQSGCDATLNEWRARPRPLLSRDLVTATRQIMPEVAITTDIIAGFPGETADGFAESLAFVKEMNFAGGHAFSYSPRPGTGAARMKEQVRPDVRKERNAIYRAAFEKSANAYRQKFIGKTLPVLWESMAQLDEHGWQMEGHTGNYLRVKAVVPAPRWNEMDDVELIENIFGVVRGEIHKIG